MPKPTSEESYPRQLAVSMTPASWRALRSLEKLTDVGAATNARRALHEFLLRESQQYRAEILGESSPEFRWILNDAPDPPEMLNETQ